MQESVPIPTTASPPRRYSSTSAVVESLLSYGRAQTFLSGSNIPSESIIPAECRLQDEENAVFEEDDSDASGYSDNDDDDVMTPIAEVDGDALALWTADPVAPASTADMRTISSPPVFSLASRNFRHHQQNNLTLPSQHHERSPLLHKLSPITHTFQDPTYLTVPSPEPHSQASSQQAADPRLRRTSVYQPQAQAIVRGNSSFTQTVLNATSLLLGLGILSEPLAFAYAGWIGGTILILFLSAFTCYTAKILARVITADPKLRTYADIGQKAFGKKSTFITSFLFCLELFSLCVVLVVLGADSLHAVLPQYSANTYKLIALLFLIPTTYLPLSLLSFTSLLSVLATFFVMVVLLVDGFSKKVGPGSLWQPAETDWVVTEWKRVGVSFGLFMAGFAGHTAIPSLARDMAEPAEFPKMINIAYVIATAIYTLMGAAGYLMFGRDVSDEVSQDLLRTVGYNPLLNKAAMWMLVISPLAKFALSSRPLNVTLEILLGIEPPVQLAPRPTLRSKTSSSSLKLTKSHRRRRSSVLPPSDLLTDNKDIPTPPPSTLARHRSLFCAIERTTLTVLVVLVAIAVPSFAIVMSFLGAFSAFLLCVIGPICAKMCIEGYSGEKARWERLGDSVLLGTAVIMATWGTVAGIFIGP